MSPEAVVPRHLVRQDYVARYEQLLHGNLPGDFVRFAPFFASMDRLDTMGAMLQRHLSGTGRSILNIGSGAFASEIFVAAFQNQNITSFDYTPEFAPLFDIFGKEGVLHGTAFMTADAMTACFAPRAFDLIVMHDLLYEPALDLDALLSRYLPVLAPGGLIYFDYMNQGVHWLWSLLGKEKRYRRYRAGEIAAILRRHDLEIVERRAVKPSGSSLKAAFHAVLTNLFRTSNAFAVIVRRRTAG